MWSGGRGQGRREQELASIGDISIRGLGVRSSSVERQVNALFFVLQAGDQLNSLDDHHMVAVGRGCVAEGACMEGSGETI